MFRNKDERISAALQRLYATGFWSILVVTLLYVVVMSTVVHAPYHEYASAFYLLAGIILYLTITPILVGLIEKDTTPLRTVLFTSGTCGIVVGLMVTVNNVMSYSDHYKNDQLYMLIPVFAISTIGAIIISLFIIFPIVYFNNWRQNEIERKLDKSEL